MGDLAEIEVDRIMAIADADNSGAIDYSEWVVATINKALLLSDEKMKQAFNLFDKDGGGSISSDEVKEVLGVGKNIDEKIWKDIIGEVDIDGNGEIDYYEFKEMMEKLITDEI
jgi:calcium-dependent protein kinase